MAVVANCSFWMNRTWGLCWVLCVTEFIIHWVLPSPMGTISLLIFLVRKWTQILQTCTDYSASQQLQPRFKVRLSSSWAFALGHYHRVVGAEFESNPVIDSSPDQRKYSSIKQEWSNIVAWTSSTSFLRPTLRTALSYFLTSSAGHFPSSPLCVTFVSSPHSNLLTSLLVALLIDGWIHYS
jgi:hypothetical protein